MDSAHTKVRGDQMSMVHTVAGFVTNELWALLAVFTLSITGLDLRRKLGELEEQNYLRSNGTVALK